MKNQSMPGALELVLKSIAVHTGTAIDFKTSSNAPGID